MAGQDVFSAGSCFPLRRGGELGAEAQMGQEWIEKGPLGGVHFSILL